MNLESKNDIPTDKVRPKSFNFLETIFNPKLPTSPNRLIMFEDFIKQKLGAVKFEKMKEFLENSNDPIKLLDEQTEVIKIMGEENKDLIKFFKLLISNSITPNNNDFFRKKKIF